MIRTLLLGSIAALAIIDHNNLVRMVVIDPGPSNPRLRGTAREQTNHAKVLRRNRQKPLRRYPGRLY